MGILQAYKMAIKSIWGAKVRSLLTMLGVIIGVGAVIAAVAFAQGSTKNITDSISALGTDLLQVRIFGRASNRQVTFEQIKAFADENSEEIAGVAPTVSDSLTAKYSTNTRDTTVVGTTAAYESIKSYSVQSGRFITEIDSEYRKNVAVIGTAIVNDIFEGANPVGEKIKLDGTIFTVIGVLTELDDGQDDGDDDQVIIPISVAQRLFKSTRINNFTVQTTNEEFNDSVSDKISDFLIEIYNDEDIFMVMNSAQMVETLNDVSTQMMLILGGIATISLLVGGIGIMNIMLVSVTERTREIGVRKAIGAKRKSILVQFLIEALMVTGIGGLLGVLLGVCIIKFIFGGFDIVPEVYSATWILRSFGISLIVGVVFGMFPANKASKLNPIQALRYE